MVQGKLHILWSMVLSTYQPWVVVVDEVLPTIFLISIIIPNITLEQIIQNSQNLVIVIITMMTLLLMSTVPFSISAISCLMEIKASQNLSNSAYNSKIPHVMLYKMKGKEKTL